MPRQAPHGAHRSSNSSRIAEPPHYPRRAPRGDEVDENDRFVASFLNGRSLCDVLTFPREILESNGKLLALFKVWKGEHQVFFPAGREEARRFEAFKRGVEFVDEINSSSRSWTASLNRYALTLPSTDPCPGCYKTEEEAEEIRQRFPPRRYDRA